MDGSYIRQWVRDNILMDIDVPSGDEDKLVSAVMECEPAGFWARQDEIPNIDTLRRCHYPGRQLDDKHSELAILAVDVRRDLLAQKLARSGVKPVDELVYFLESARIFDAGMLVGTFYDNVYDDCTRREPGNGYARDSYGFKAAAASSWPKCSVFHGDRHHIGIVNALSAMGIIPADTEYVLLAETTLSTGSMLDAIDAGLVDVDLEHPAGDRALLAYSSRDLAYTERLSGLAAYELGLHVGIVHKWSGMHEKPFLTEIRPYPDMPEQLGRTFERYFAFSPLRMESCNAVYKMGNRWQWFLHTWDVDSLLDDCVMMALGHFPEEDEATVRECMGMGGPFRYIMPDEPDEDIVSTWLDEHGHSQELMCRARSAMASMHAVDAIWKTVGARELESVTRNTSPRALLRSRLGACADKHGLGPLLECSLAHGVAVEDVLA